jgi:hypothetical protein
VSFLLLAIAIGFLIVGLLFFTAVVAFVWLVLKLVWVLLKAVILLVLLPFRLLFWLIARLMRRPAHA